jgi:hypothetical protein
MEDVRPAGQNRSVMEEVVSLLLTKELISKPSIDAA